MLSEEIFQEIFQETVRPLYRMVSRRTAGNKELSEDIVQEAFLKAVGNWRREGIPAEPLAWLKRVALNLLASHYRTLGAKQRHRAPTDTPSHGDAEELLGLRLFLNKGLTLLSGGHREILRAFHVEGRTTREIAEEMEISQRAVEGRLRRARISLRQKLNSLLPKETGNA